MIVTKRIGFDDRGRLFDKNGIFYPDGSVGLWTNK